MIRLLIVHLQYGAKIIPVDQTQEYEWNVPIYTLDLYENWEKFCGMLDQILGIIAFHREGLIEKLKKLVVGEGNG